MAVAIERLKPNIISIETLLKSVKEFVNLDKSPKAIPWESIHDSGIPDMVIWSTAGQCFKYEAALECPIPPEKNDGVRYWRTQARKNLLDHLHRTPRSREVYESLRQSYVVTIDVKETLGDKWQMFKDDAARGRDRLLTRLYGCNIII